jgi:hypothetical protein
MIITVLPQQQKFILINFVRPTLQNNTQFIVGNSNLH